MNIEPPMAQANLQSAVATCQIESYQRPSLLTTPPKLRDMIIAPFLQPGDLVILPHLPHHHRRSSGAHQPRSDIPSQLQHQRSRKHQHPSKSTKCRHSFPSPPQVGIRKWRTRSNPLQSGILGDRGDGAMTRYAITISYNRGHSFATPDEQTRLQEILPRGTPITAHVLVRVVQVHSL